jgi:hypothetical protein
MKTWLTSPGKTLALAAIGLLSFVGYIFLAGLVLGAWNLNAGMAALATILWWS